eukprot:357488-Chlamydomonas_euryale.AAC.3
MGCPWVPPSFPPGFSLDSFGFPAGPRSMKKNGEASTRTSVYTRRSRTTADVLVRRLRRELECQEDRLKGAASDDGVAPAAREPVAQRLGQDDGADGVVEVGRLVGNVLAAVDVCIELDQILRVTHTQRNHRFQTQQQHDQVVSVGVCVELDETLNTDGQNASCQASRG